jgi:hypothetical protein
MCCALLHPFAVAAAAVAAGNVQLKARSLLTAHDGYTTLQFK